MQAAACRVGSPGLRCQQADQGLVSGVTDGRTAALARYRQDSAACPGRDIMHPMFKELFIETDAEDLAAEEDRRRRVLRSQRARSAMVVRSC